MHALDHASRQCTIAINNKYYVLVCMDALESDPDKRVDSEGGEGAN